MTCRDCETVAHCTNQKTCLAPQNTVTFGGAAACSSPAFAATTASGGGAGSAAAMPDGGAEGGGGVQSKLRESPQSVQAYISILEHDSKRFLDAIQELASVRALKRHLNNKDASEADWETYDQRRKAAWKQIKRISKNESL